MAVGRTGEIVGDKATDATKVALAGTMAAMEDIRAEATALEAGALAKAVAELVLQVLN